MSRNTHIIDLTKRIVIGLGVLESLTRHLPSHLRGCDRRFLVVSGPNVWRLYSSRIERALGNNSLEVELVDSAHIEVANQVVDRAESLKVHAIIGFGGGKSIDVAKYAASRLKKPFISIPTAASHDGVVSSFASLRGREKPTSFKAVEPILLVADIDIIASAPRRLLVAGAGDAIAKFTAVLDWRLAYHLKNEYYGEYAANLALLSAKHIVRHRHTIASDPIAGARVVLEALISSSVAMSIAGSTRPASGSEHLFSHALDMILEKPALHGEQTGVGTIMMARLHRINWRKIRKVLKAVGAPTTAKELGIPEEKIIEALTIAHTIRPERYTILGREGLTREAAEKLALETGVIQ